MLVFLLAGCAAAFAGEAPVKVRATASATEVSVAQPFTVELQAEGPAGTVWSFPAAGGDEKVELTAEKPKEGEAPHPDRQSYRAAVFAVSGVAIPPVKVGYRLPDGRQGETSTAPVELRIVSLLPKDPAEHKLADIRPPVGLPVGPYFWASLTVGVATLTAAAIAISRQRRRRPAGEATPSAPAVPPNVEALAALDRLAASSLLARGELRAFYIELAEIAKRYLECRLGAPILEMTSTETVGFLRDHADARDLTALARDLTGAADQVKFARGSAELATAERHLAAARGMVATLEARLQPAAEPAQERGA